MNAKRKLEKKADEILANDRKNRRPCLEYPYLTDRQLKRRRKIEICFGDNETIEYIAGIYKRSSPIGRPIDSRPKGERDRYYKEIS